MSAGVDRSAECVAGYLRELTGRFPDRSVGSPGNRAATALFAEVAAGFGFEVSRTEFDCVTWEPGDAMLEVASERPDVHVGRFHPNFHPVPATVVSLVVRVVAEHVLFTELFQNAKEHRPILNEYSPYFKTIC